VTTRLGASHAALMKLLRRDPELSDLTEALNLLAQRRKTDLSDLPPGDQATLIASRSAELLPSTDRLVDLLTTAGRPLVVKYGIDPTAADVHVGHAVPMMVASRFARMGHTVVFIVGDITAKIGDPSGRTADRPTLTEADITANMATYRDQVGPFFDFTRGEFRLNSEWLSAVTLPRFLSILEKLPVSASLQREDFRGRLGAGLTLAELVYSVVMALDSAEIRADVEIGGLDQLLNLQMCRRVMENAGLPPEVIIATGLIEGTDGSGAKMSKSKGNYIALGASPRDVFGKLMSAPDRLLPQYLRALTELLDPEIERVLKNPMRAKTLLAADVTAAIHGLQAAQASRTAFTAQFSRRRFSDLPDVPVVDPVECGQSTVAEVFVRVTSLVASLNQVRRVAAGGGLRLVVEAPGQPQEVTVLRDADAPVPHVAPAPARTFLKCGRRVVELR
jgi:tyrosyl-tRNA synthetase